MHPALRPAPLIAPASRKPESNWTFRYVVGTDENSVILLSVIVGRMSYNRLRVSDNRVEVRLRPSWTGRDRTARLVCGGAWTSVSSQNRRGVPTPLVRKDILGA